MIVIISGTHSKLEQETAKMFAKSHQIISRRAPLILALSLGLLFCLSPEQQAKASTIGYFENYGWPTYGIVKPFWMTPFSAFPSRSISGYSRKHSMYHGRGLLKRGF